MCVAREMKHRVWEGVSRKIVEISAVVSDLELLNVNAEQSKTRQITRLQPKAFNRRDRGENPESAEKP
jgi:hypothetical protein